MTDSNYTAIKIVVDRSGSMELIRTDAEGAINAFVKDQKSQPGRATINICQFDDVYDNVIPTMDIQSAPRFVLDPRNMTALNDAIGKGTVELGAELAALPEDERPGHVIFIIVTDGGENASKEYTASVVKTLVEKQTNKYGWNYVFLAANQDAVLTGKDYGFTAGNSMTWGANAAGVANTGAALSTYATTTRSGVSYEFTEADRKSATGV